MFAASDFLACFFVLSFAFIHDRQVNVGCSRRSLCVAAGSDLSMSMHIFNRRTLSRPNIRWVMAIEHARARAIPKPWGVVDLRPWSNAPAHDKAIGEIWYERPDTAAVDPSLLLKLLFTSQPLSIQVHPDDTFAHSMGLPNGKTEAWYVLSAAPEAKVALGLKRRLTPQQLREAIDDGSISDLVAWHPVSADDIIFVARRNDSRDRRGSCHRGNPAAKRRDVPSVRLRPAARTSRRRRHRGGGGRAGRVSDAIEPAYRRTAASRFQPPLRVRTDRSGAKLLLVPGSGTRDLASRSRRQRRRRIVRRCHRRCPLSRNRIRSTFTPARPEWSASWRTPAAALFRTCCDVSRSRAPIECQTAAGDNTMPTSRSIRHESLLATNGGAETIK